MESPALAKMAASCRDRMMFVDIGPGVKDPLFADRLSALQSCKTLTGLIQQFSKYFQGISIDYLSELRQFREKCKHITGYSPRCASMVYCYDVSIRTFNRFLLERGYDPLDLGAVEKIEENFFLQKSTDDVSGQQPLEDVVLHELLTSGEIKPYRCSVHLECDFHLRTGCKYRCATCESGYCPQGYAPEWRSSYAPHDLILDLDHGYNSLLLFDPSNIPNFSRPYRLPPLLLIGSEELTWKMNSVLEGYCSTRKISPIYFTHQKLHTALGQCNRCLILPNGDHGNKYTIPHVCVANGDDFRASVIVLILTEEEAQFFLDTFRSPSSIDQYHRFNLTHLSAKVVAGLKSEWPKLHRKVGPIGRCGNLG